MRVHVQALHSVYYENFFDLTIPQNAHNIAIFESFLG